MANWIAFVSILQLAKSIECKTISLNSPSERRAALLLMGQRHATALHEYIASFIEQSMSRATLSWVLGELSLPALHFVLFILLFYCLNAAASRAREKRDRKWESKRESKRESEREVDGGQGEHYCNLSHTLWQHVCRHFYHFRIYVVSAWAASKLRSRLLLYCPTRSGNGSQHPVPSNSTRAVQCPFRNMCADCGWRGTAIFAAQAARASMVSQGPRTTRLTLRPNELFWFNLSNRSEQSIGPPPILPQKLVMLEKSIFMLVKGLTANGDSYSVQRWITAQIQAMNSALK